MQRRHLADAQNEIERLTAFWHYFRRRRRQKSLESLRNHVVVADAAVGDLHAERSAIDHEAAPEFPGHFVGGPPQHQSCHHQLRGIAVRDTSMRIGLAARAKEAVARRVHEMNFGTRADCEGYMQRVQKAQAAVANQKQITAARQSQAGAAARDLRVPQQRRYGSDRRFAGAARPRIWTSARRQARAAATWNVLAEDYWDLYTLLLR